MDHKEKTKGGKRGQERVESGSEPSIIFIILKTRDREDQNIITDNKTHKEMRGKKRSRGNRGNRRRPRTSCTLVLYETGPELSRVVAVNDRKLEGEGEVRSIYLFEKIDLKKREGGNCTGGGEWQR